VTPEEVFVTLTWNGRRVDWVNVVYFAAIHAMALLAFWTFSWTGLGLALVGWWVAGSLGICLTYHRLLTHRGFRTSKPLEYLGTVFGMLASEGGAISWVAMHRLHHARSDRSGQDLHTPKDGFWWSHMGWIVCDLPMERREMERRYAPEMVADPVHRILNRIHVVPNILVGLGLYAWGGWPYVIWGVFVRLVITLHGTWLVNSATHTWGYRVWNTNEDSRNLWWVGLLAWGEGWHNTHHAFQRSARHGFGWELDATWLVIRALSMVGLVRDIHLLPKNAERFRIQPKKVEQTEAVAA
jgi:fatty-acid desaturase